MRLKSIEMQGFKSFADKIYLDFNPGITAIVGPNGSGKSNISDAIRWVMGEQSAKSLRGAKMEDVIFSGTETRKPLGFAEVTLVLDNSDHYFSLDFPEITVTRRVYRSGDGEYYINKTLCRLKDIHELFMDTGLGRDGYSIIGQGKIDSILSTKSEDRRQIFEEAAGISKYRYRKIEAERKLLQTNDNLLRVEDILGELESRLGPLERQSEKARRYLILRDEMRGLDITVSVTNAEKAKAQLAELNGSIQILVDQIDGIQGNLDETDQEITQMYQTMAEHDTAMENCRATDRETVEAIHEEKNRVTLLTSELEHSDENLKRLEEELSEGGKEIERIDQTAAGYQEELGALQAKNQGVDQSLAELQEASKEAGRDVDAKNDALESTKAELIELTAEINALRAGNSSLDMLAENFRSRASVVSNGKEEKNQEKASLLKQQDETQQELNACDTKMKAEEAKITEIRQKEDVVEGEISSLAETLNQTMVAVQQKQSRKTMLGDMERDFEGYARGVKGVMSAYQKKKIPNATIYGPLAQLIQTDQKYIVAIETALGAANQNIVTATEEDAKAAIEYLKTQKLGRATFLPVSAIRGKSFDLSKVKNLEGFVALASDLVRCEDRYFEIVKHFLGATVVCDTLDHGIAIAKRNKHSVRIVTLDGDVIQSGGAMTGGSQGKTTGSLSRIGEMETLGEEISALEEKKKKIEKEQEILLQKKEKLQADRQERESIIQEIARDQVRLSAEMSHFDTLIAGVETTLAQMEREAEDIKQRIDSIEAEKKEKTTLIEQKEVAYQTLEEQARFMQIEYTSLSGKNELLISKLTELNLTKNTILKDIELQNERMSRLQTEKAQYVLSMTEKSAEAAALRKRKEDLGGEIIAANLRAEALEKELTEYRSTLEELSGKRTALEQALRGKQESVKVIQEEIFRLTQQQGKLEARVTKHELEIEGIVNRLWEEYELPYSDAVSMKQEEGFDFSSATIRIQELKEAIRGLGNINLDAIDEYKEIQERFTFLRTQADDLTKAKGELETVIKEMLGIMQERFEKQFNVINNSFNRVFSELFGGGQANLILTEPDNILESGIEIEAQPPGKKLQNLTLLSGGERAFTAIALLFAILEVRPTPFCILDEIEAALDDVNVYRTAEYLKRYSGKTQFIVVTHRRGTMESANILYGVTMQERGISKLLSLNIDEVSEKTEV